MTALHKVFYLHHPEPYLVLWYLPQFQSWYLLFCLPLFPPLQCVYVFLCCDFWIIIIIIFFFVWKTTRSLLVCLSKLPFDGPKFRSHLKSRINENAVLNEIGKFINLVERIFRFKFDVFSTIQPQWACPHAQIVKSLEQNSTIYKKEEVNFAL